MFIACACLSTIHKYYLPSSFKFSIMRFLFLTLLIILWFPLLSFCYTPTRIPVKLGDNEIYLLKYDKAGESMVFVHVHENETSSLEAGLHTWNRTGGKLITLVHSFDGSKNRFVTFSHKKTTYRFDPNRIYTHDRTILKNNISVVKGKGEVDDFIVSEVEKLAKIIWREVDGFSFIIALHNNKNEAGALVRKNWFKKVYREESFNITSYVKKFDTESSSNLSCDDIYINPRLNNSEFFIVTERRDFSILYRKRYTVVLQNDNPIDDGSMSVFAKKYNIRYVNTEAKMGRIKEQIEMLRILLDL